jgi:hypothetical protein
MVKPFVPALCLVAAAGTTLAMSRAELARIYAERRNEWPFSEIILDSPFKYNAVAEAMPSITKAPCSAETPVGNGQTINNPDTPAAFMAYKPFQNNATVYSWSNSAFVLTTMNQTASYEYSGNTFLGWINQQTYDPNGCWLTCDALNATGIKCNTFNSCGLTLQTTALSLFLENGSRGKFPQLTNPARLHALSDPYAQQ